MSVLHGKMWDNSLRAESGNAVARKRALKKAPQILKPSQNGELFLCNIDFGTPDKTEIQSKERIEKRNFREGGGAPSTRRGRSPGWSRKGFQGETADGCPLGVLCFLSHAGKEVPARHQGKT